MKEKLIIQNFGPIKSVELEFGRFNVLIGPSASGKSTIAKVLSVCRYFSYIHPTTSHEEKNKSYFQMGLVAWGLLFYAQPTSYIRYECDDYELEARPEGEWTILTDNETEEYRKKVPVLYSKLISKSERFRELLKIHNTAKVEQGDSTWITWPSFFLNYINNILDNPAYLPAERGMQSFFLGEKTLLQNLSDKLSEQLSKIAMRSQAPHFRNREIDGLIYKTEHKEDIFSIDGGKTYFPMKDASNGIKSLIPIYSSVEYYRDSSNTKTIIIEEPELSLFPDRQSELMRYLAECVNDTDVIGRRKHLKFLLTTHSPYTLTSLNNMMYAYELGQKNENAVGEIINKKYWLNPSEVSAYRMLEDGTCEDIMDYDESGTLIKADKIDGVSRILNEEFDKLININIEVDK